jgi:hypothetical protein
MVPHSGSICSEKTESGCSAKLAMESVSTILFSLYRGTPLHPEWVVACLAGAWKGLLGERVANVCRPRALNRAELVVEVLEKEWLPALASMKQELLFRIGRATGGEVRRLSFRTAPARAEAQGRI